MDFSQRVSDAKAALVSGQDSVLTQVLNDLATNVANDQKGADGTLTQADLDAAVSAAVGPLNDQIVALQAKDDADVKSLEEANVHISDLESQLAAMTAQDQADKALVQKFRDSLASLKAAVAALEAAEPT